METVDTSLKAGCEVALGKNDVHIWSWTHESILADTDAISCQILSEAELHRAGLFRSEKDRIRYTASHVILRILLGRYLDAPPSALCFKSNEFGKPRLSEAHADQNISFNLSHCGQIGAIGFATDLTVGVDVEEVRTVEKEIVQHWFSPEEQRALGGLTGIDWLHAFYRCWTRKEAILKAEGTGIGEDLRATNVSVGLNLGRAVINKERRDQRISEWHVIDFEPSPNAVGAVATDGVPASEKLYRLTADGD